MATYKQPTGQLMKAWLCTELGAPSKVLSLVDTTLPVPGPGEIQLQVHAAAIGLPDVMMCRGTYEFKPPIPFTAGQEVCGTVLAVGDGVTVQPGDRVLGVSCFFNGQGGFAEECMSMEGMVFKAPDSMPDIEAAAFCIPYQTAWIGLVSRGSLQASDTLLVHGAAGGSGAAAVQLGHALGARVIAVVSSEDKATAVRNWGADEVIDRRHHDVASEVNRLTEGMGANIIFDPVGGEVFKSSVSCLANEGRLLAVGFASGQWGEADMHDLVFKNASALGVYVGAYTPEQRQAIHDKLVALYQQGSIAPTVQEVVSFDKLPQALTEVASGKVAGKLVIAVRSQA
jgi:NADPH2:quinone reductase